MEGETIQKNNLKILAPWIISGLIFVCLIVTVYLFWTANSENVELKNQKQALEDEKSATNGKLEEIKSENVELKKRVESMASTALPIFDLEEAREKAQKASIKSTMASMTPMAIICRDAGGTVLSGNVGDPACSNDAKAKWPSLSACGESPGDLKFTVFNGGKDNWDITINCKNVTDCNGPQNALCNSISCQFKGTCQ